MGNPLNEVELAEAKEKGSVILPNAIEAESVEVPLLLSKSSPPHDTNDENDENDDDANTREFQKYSQTPVAMTTGEESSCLNGNKMGKNDLKSVNCASSELSDLDGPGGDQDQAPLLSAQKRSDQKVLSSPSPQGMETIAYTPESLKEMEIKYAAYVRHDHYGNWGTRDVSFLEKTRLLVALGTLCPVRVILLTLLLVTFYVICKLCTLRVLASSDDEGQESFAHMTGPRRTIVVRSGRFLARTMLFVFGFYYIPVTYRTPDRMQNLHLGMGDLDESSKENEDEREKPSRPGAIVSNHVSYLDILYHMSASFPSFVAKVCSLLWVCGGACVFEKRSVARLPLVGLISKCLGCVYVQRESKSSDFKGVSGVVSERLQAAHHDSDAPALLLFPEGTTTNGDYLLPFKTGAFRAHTPVKPVILKYPYKRFSPAWDTISGVRHLILLLCQFVNHLEVVRLPVYQPTEKEYADPKLYANNVRTLMADEGNLTMTDIGLHEKRIFHAALLGKQLPIAPTSQEAIAGSGSG